MNIINRTETFDKWLHKLRDRRAKARIIRRIEQAEEGNFGDCEAVGSGISEMRIFVGAGYRVYFMQTGDVIYLLLSGGDKSTQQKDIAKAHTLAEAIKQQNEGDKNGENQ